MKEHKEKFINEWDSVCYDIKKFVHLLAKGNPNVLSLLWLKDLHYIYRHPVGQILLDNRDLFTSKEVYHSFAGYAHGQFHRMTHYKHEGYMGEKRKKLVEQFGYDTKHAAHLIRLLEMCTEYLVDGVLRVERVNASKLLSIKHGEWSLEKVKQEAEELFSLAREAYIRSPLPVKVDEEKVNTLVMRCIMKYHELRYENENQSI